MIFDFKFLNSAKDHDPSEIKAIKPDELFSTLIRWLDSWHDASYVDDESISYAGIMIAKAGHIGLDKKLYNSYPKKHSKLGFEITNSFLSGYWSFTPVADLPTVDYLLSELQKTSINTDACASAVLALNTLITSSKIELTTDKADAIRKLLLHYYKEFVKKDIHLGVTVYLEDWCDKLAINDLKKLETMQR